MFPKRHYLKCHLRGYCLGDEIEPRRTPTAHSRTNKIHQILITHKDRLNLIGFDLFQDLFHEFGTEIIVINELESLSTEQEIFQEIISLLHCYAMAMYSRRRRAFTQIKAMEFEQELTLSLSLSPSLNNAIFPMVPG